MSRTTPKQKTIKLPKDFQEFAEECVREGKSASIEEVVRDAFQEMKLAALRGALDHAIAQSDAGLGAECTPEEFMARSDRRLGFTS